MHRSLCLSVGILLLAGAGVMGARDAARAASNPCENSQTGDPCDDKVFCNGQDLCAVKPIDGKPVLGCFAHLGNPCIGGPECAKRCDEAQATCNDPAGTPCTDDGNPCTDDVCDGAGNCSNPPMPTGTPCDDDIFCNGADTCADGTCTGHAGDPCTGGPECANTCNESSDDCFVAQGTACADDGNACTTDECDGLGVCANVPNNEPCDDGVFCNGEDHCRNGTCSLHSGDPCGGAAECEKVCDETAEACPTPLGTPCADDGNPCTKDLCMSGGCVHSVIPGCAVCSADGDCDDGNPCTTDSCRVDGCDNTLVAGCRMCTADAQCQDGDSCTVDRCSPAGQCLYSDAQCFAALTCSFSDGFTADACAGERIPRSLTKRIDRAGCKVEQAEARAYDGRPRVEKKLRLATRQLGRAANKVQKARGRKISAGCADALSEDLAVRLGKITGLIDGENDGALLAACTAGLTTTAEAAAQQTSPSLCTKR